MLQLIRDHATGWIAWVIVILICVPFALWGIYDYLSPNPTIAVATVNGTELTYAQYQQAFQNHRNRLRRLLGGQLDLADLDQGLLRQQSLESMIQDELLIQAAASDGLRIGDEQLARAIHVQESFQTDGEFDVGRYENWLRNQGYSPGGFEYELRRSLITEQLLSGVGGTAFATNADRQRMSTLVGQIRSFSYLTIPLSRFSDLEIPEEAIADYFADHGTSLVTEEAISIDYIELSRDAIADNIEVAEEDLRAVYESSKINFTQPERREASHILLRLDDETDDAAVAQAMAKAQALLDRLTGGEGFAVLAKEHSEDPGSSTKGGDLGYFERGVLVPAFEIAVFGLQVGELSEVVRSPFGLHIIKLTGIQERRTKTFEEAREEVKLEYRTSQAERLYYEQLDRMEVLAFEAPDSLEVAADELGLEIINTDKFTRQGSTTDLVAADPKVVEAAFGEDVLYARNNSGAILLADNRAVVLRVTEHEASRAQTLQESRGEIVLRVKDEQARARGLEALTNADAHLSSGGSRESLSQQLGIEWVSYSEVGRDDSTIEPGVIKKVFELPRPEDGRESYATVTTMAGEGIVIALSAVEEGDAEKLDPELRKSLDNRLVSDYGRGAFDAFVQILREQSEVVVNEDSLDR